MIILLSPSKTLDYESTPTTTQHTQPDFLRESTLLIKELRRYSQPELATLMGLSDKLAALNVERYKTFKTPFTEKNARQALLAFKGDVYEGMDVAEYRAKDFDYAQSHLRILSGLYGLLKPLDLMQPYRLEMGTSLKNTRGKNLYDFWGDRITDALNSELAKQKNKTLINLASQEYFKAVNVKKLQAPLLHIHFKEKKDGSYKTIGLFAKRARGMMANYIIQNRIEEVDALNQFREGGYAFSAKLSTHSEYVFTR